VRLAIALFLAGPLLAQTGQQGARANWPCVPGRAMDPAYLDLSESTGGQLVLFQPGEAQHSGVVMSASFTHPATIVRLVGHLNGTRELEFPVDSTVESLLVLASVQCRERVAMVRPTGVEVTSRDAPLLTELKAATFIRLDQPEPGPWKVKLTGSGLYVLSVLAKTSLKLTSVRFPERGAAAFHLSGDATRPALQLIDATGAPLSTVLEPESAPAGDYQANIGSPSARYRLLVTGRDANAWPFQRVHPNLFRAP
jgi:hypothetical protein